MTRLTYLRYTLPNEVARAGERGCGFAVVAYEVRSFASKTQDSMEEIHNTINNLITASNDAVDVMA